MRKKPNKLSELPGCKKRGYYDGIISKICAACRTMLYCSREHQLDNRKAHVAGCKAIVRATKNTHQVKEKA